MDENKTIIPHIYNFKTPERHFIGFSSEKKCEKQWKRLEFLSTTSSLIFKDDGMDAGAWTGPYFKDQQTPGERKGE